MSSNTAPAPEENEPSMEEILASIRKIIADDSLGTKKDETQPRRPLKAPPSVPVPPEIEEEDADVLDLAQVATVTAQDVAEPVQQSEEMSMPQPAEVTPARRAVEAGAQPITSVVKLEDRIISDNTSALVGQAFAQLQRNTLMPGVGRSLEDVVVELLRPMLRTWVDEHLPSIVEKLVKIEIERVARGG